MLKDSRLSLFRVQLHHLPGLKSTDKSVQTVQIYSQNDARMAFFDKNKKSVITGRSAAAASHSEHSGYEMAKL